MTTYYLDPTATGANNGTSTTDAWETFQDSIDGTNGSPPSSGDIILCRNTQDPDETISSAIDFATSDISGTDRYYIKWIGVNSAWENDGTQYIMSTDGSSINGWVFQFSNHLWFENFELKSTGGTGNGIYGSDWDAWYLVFINCYIHDFSDWGFYSYYATIDYTTFFKCRFSSNGIGGCLGTENSIYCICCRFDNNTGDGYSDGELGDYPSYLYGCIAHDNGGYGIKYIGRCSVINCIGYNNGKADFASGDNDPGASLIGCRAYSTSPAYNFDGQNNISHGLYYCYGQGGVSGVYTDNYINISCSGSTTSLIGTDTNGGFVDPAGGDFNLASDATGRLIAVEVP